MRYFFISNLFIFLMGSPTFSAMPVTKDTFQDGPERKMGTYVKEALGSLSSEEIHDQMQDHFAVMQVINCEGRWKDPSLDNISSTLLPVVTVQDLGEMVDVMVENAEKNPYLHQFMLAAEKEDFKEFYRQVKTDGAMVIPNVMTFAMALDNLTKSMRRDVKIARAMFKIWDQTTQPFDIYNTTNLAYMVKYYLVRSAVKICIESIERKTNPDSFKNVLFNNILMAALVELIHGNYGNAFAGYVLAKHQVDGSKDSRTDAGPSKFSIDRNITQFYPPFPKNWADLYQSWNLGFVSQLASFPYWVIKLLIPQVSGYHESPEEFLYNRALALYASMNFDLHMRKKKEKHPYSLNWSYQSVINCFSRVNYQSALIYEKKVQDAVD